MAESTAVEPRTCTAEGVAVTTATRFTATRLARVEELVRALESTARANGGLAAVMHGDLMRLVSELREIGHGVVEVEFDSCPFDGDVDVIFNGHVARWMCPVCRTEYAEPLTKEDRYG